MRACESIEVLIFAVTLSDDAIVEMIRAGVRGLVSKSDPAADLLKALDALAVRRTHFSRTVAVPLVKRVLAGKKLGQVGLLSKRELEVLQLVGEGRLTREIAPRLGISKKTADYHRIKVMQKLNCRNTADLVRYAVRNNVVQA